MAEPQSLYVICRRKQIAGECPDCHFDALVQVSHIALLPSGVTEWLMEPYCGRCRAEARRLSGES